jgi:hypothetical protein
MRASLCQTPIFLSNRSTIVSLLNRGTIALPFKSRTTGPTTTPGAWYLR